MSCRFRFSHPPSTRILVTKPVTGDNETEANKASKILGKVRKLLLSGKTDVSLEDLLRLTEVNPNDFNNAIELSIRGHTIVLKREPCECDINPYNPSVLLLWCANMDFQPVFNAYSCIKYIASYIMKADKSMGQLLKSVTEEVIGEELLMQLKKIGTAFLSHRELGAQEAVYHILSLPLKMLSRSVVYVDSNTEEKQIGDLKDNPFLVILDENDTNMLKKSLIDRYQHRPHSLRSMCLAEFAANYTTDYDYLDDEDTDIVPSTDDDGLQASSEIILTGR
uniref:ATP-dependent DNA helicase n=1 Tax=Amphimedon queenslandica TaxID=400682 RepID=A0A1X7VYF6_AMPQE